MNRLLVVVASFLFTWPLQGADVCNPGEIYRVPGRADIGSSAVVGDTAFILTSRSPDQPQRLVRIELSTGVSKELMNWPGDSGTSVNEIATDGRSLVYTRWNGAANELWAIDVAAPSAVRLMPADAPVALHIAGPYVYGLRSSSTTTENGRTVWLPDGELIRVPLAGGSEQTLASALIVDYDSDLAVKDSGIFVLARDGIHRITKDGESLVYAGSNLQSLAATDDDALWFASVVQLSSYAHNGLYEVQTWRLDPTLRPRLFATTQFRGGVTFPAVRFAVVADEPPVRTYTTVAGWIYTQVSSEFYVSYEDRGTVTLSAKRPSFGELLAGRGASFYVIAFPPEGAWFGTIVRMCVPNPPAPLARRRVVR